MGKGTTVAETSILESTGQSPMRKKDLVHEVSDAEFEKSGSGGEQAGLTDWRLGKMSVLVILSFNSFPRQSREGHSIIMAQ